MESTDEMARGVGEPSTKRAKLDEAGKEEEEDPLVLRKEEVVRLLEEASTKGEDNARAKEELVTLCADLEAKNEKLLGRLLPELWSKIVDEYLHQNDLLAFAMTCRFFRDTTKVLGKKMRTNLNASRLLGLQKSGRMPSHSLGWFQWVCDTFEILPGFECADNGRVEGAVYKGELLNYAAFQGSVEILRWLVEEKGWELNFNTGMWAGVSGSIEVLEYLDGMGYNFVGNECEGAAHGGHLEALKYLKGLHCGWDSDVCALAAAGGHLEVLKFARGQNPPCEWGRSMCRDHASCYGHQHVVEWIDQLGSEDDTDWGWD